MNDDNAERESTQTRRRVLQGTVAGATAATGLASVASAGECNVTQEDKQRVRDKYGTEEQLRDTLREQTKLREAIQDENLVEGEDVAVQVAAPVFNCEVIPEYRVYRNATEDRNLTVRLRPNQNTSWGVYKDPYLTNPCVYVVDEWGCNTGCYDDDCCSCSLGLCGTSYTPSDSFCCFKCDCTCNDYDCIHHCLEMAPDPIDVSTGWWAETIL